MKEEMDPAEKIKRIISWINSKQGNLT